MAKPVRAVCGALACLFIAWALYLFTERPTLTFSGGEVEVSCQSLYVSGWSDNGSTSAHRTFNVSRGDLRATGSDQVDLGTIWERVNGQCDRRRTARLAAIVFILVPATVLASVAASPVRRASR